MKIDIMARVLETGPPITRSRLTDAKRWVLCGIGEGGRGARNLYLEGYARFLS